MSYYICKHLVWIFPRRCLVLGDEVGVSIPKKQRRRFAVHCQSLARYCLIRTIEHENAPPRSRLLPTDRSSVRQTHGGTVPLLVSERTPSYTYAPSFSLLQSQQGQRPTDFCFGVKVAAQQRWLGGFLDPCILQFSFQSVLRGFRDLDSNRPESGAKQFTHEPEHVRIAW